jgi:hypothetical protein
LARVDALAKTARLPTDCARLAMQYTIAAGESAPRLTDAAQRQLRKRQSDAIDDCLSVAARVAKRRRR